jgi:hypothetical protein
MLNSGIVETVVLITLLILFVLNEVLSGIEIEEGMRLQRMVQLGTIPLTLFFLLLAGARIAQLL